MRHICRLFAGAVMLAVWAWPSWAQINSSQSSGTLVFQPGGTERMRIVSSGNAGIGLVTPTQRLSVSGTIESTSGGFKFPNGGTQISTGLRMIGYAQRNDTTTFSFGAGIPYDNTIPQVSEGAELISSTVTVSASATTLYFWVQGPNYVESANHSDSFTLALFRSGQAGNDALAAYVEEGDYAYTQGAPSVLWRLPSPGAGTYTFSVRGGCGNGGTIINRNYNITNTLSGNLNQMSFFIAEQ